MSKLILLIGLMVFSVLAVASPINFDVGLSGYSATGIANMDNLVGGKTSAIAEVIDVAIDTENSLDFKLKPISMPYQSKAKTGIGAYKTDNLDGFQIPNRNYNRLQHEVGWRISA